MDLLSILNLFLMIKGKKITFDVIIIFCINIFIFNPISHRLVTKRFIPQAQLLHGDPIAHRCNWGLSLLKLLICYLVFYIL